MKKFSRGIAAVLMTASTTAESQEPEAVDRIVGRFVESEAPGCFVAVGKDGRKVFGRGYGLADVGHGLPITESTRFNVASVSKQFTAASILLLAEEGKLSLGDDVRKYIPELPDYGSKLTIDHLLTHTGGLRNLHSLIWVQGWFPGDRRQFTQSEALALIARQGRLNFKPGSQWSYSNSGYVLAAEIVRRVSGEPAREFMHKRLFQPLGMKSTELRDDYRTIVPGSAAGYEKEGEQLVNVAPQSLHGPGNVVSTAEDLLIWNEALDSGRLGKFVTAELQREAKTADGRPAGYARGLALRSQGGVREYGHSGGGGGYTAYLARYPDKRLSVAVTCNAMLPAPPIAHEIADLYLGGPGGTPGGPPGPGNGPGPGPGSPPARGLELEAAQVARLAGIFQDESADARLMILEAAGGTLREPDRPPLEAVSATRFRFPGGDIHFRTKDLIQIVSPDGKAILLRRIDGPRPTQARLEALAGDYRNPETLTTYRAAVDGGKLVMRIVDGPEFEFTLNPVGPDRFEMMGDVFRFVGGRGGKAEAFLWTSAGMLDLRFERLPRKE